MSQLKILKRSRDDDDKVLTFDTIEEAQDFIGIKLSTTRKTSHFGTETYEPFDEYTLKQVINHFKEQHSKEIFDNAYHDPMAAHHHVLSSVLGYDTQTTAPLFGKNAAPFIDCDAGRIFFHETTRRIKQTKNAIYAPYVSEMPDALGLSDQLPIDGKGMSREDVGVVKLSERTYFIIDKLKQATQLTDLASRKVVPAASITLSTHQVLSNEDSRSYSSQSAKTSYYGTAEEARAISDKYTAVFEDIADSEYNESPISTYSTLGGRAFGKGYERDYHVPLFSTDKLSNGKLGFKINRSDAANLGMTDPSQIHLNIYHGEHFICTSQVKPNTVYELSDDGIKVSEAKLVEANPDTLSFP
ncbi:hypothetical protein AB4254_13575 [Vibrio breoganii]